MFEAILIMFAVATTVVVVKEDTKVPQPQVVRTQIVPQRYCESAIIMGKRVYRCQEYGVTHDSDYRVER
jgi:hypothetical protein